MDPPKMLSNLPPKHSRFSKFIDIWDLMADDTKMFITNGLKHIDSPGGTSMMDNVLKVESDKFIPVSRKRIIAGFLLSDAAPAGGLHATPRRCHHSPHVSAAAHCNLLVCHPSWRRVVVPQ